MEDVEYGHGYDLGVMDARTHFFADKAFDFAFFQGFD